MNRSKTKLAASVIAVLAACAETQEPAPAPPPVPDAVYVRGDVRYTANEPYSDEPIELEGFFVCEKAGGKTRLYVELGVISDGTLKPELRIFHDDTTLAIVWEESLTYSEQTINADVPARWRPWTFLVHPIVPETAETFDVVPKPRKSGLLPPFFQDRSDLIVSQDRPCIGTITVHLRTRGPKTSFIKEASVHTLTWKTTPMEIVVTAQCANTTTVCIDATRSLSAQPIDLKCFDLLPMVKAVLNQHGKPKYREVK